MKKLKNLFAHGIFRIIRLAFFILVLGYVILVVVRVFQMLNADRTEAQIIKIHATRLELADVMGDNLPPDPGLEANETIAGIDANNNGIRDDVELAIFEQYPDSPKTRAALLQYALALQMETTQSFVNTTIATEIVREQSRGFQCIGKIFPNQETEESYQNLQFLVLYVKNKQFNTKERKNSRSIFLEDVRSYSDLDSVCDLDYSNYKIKV